MPSAPQTRSAQPATGVTAAGAGGFTARRRDSSSRTATALRPKMAIAIPIGRALCGPARPTKGAATAPMENCSTPSNADALPAACGKSLSARAIALGATKPLEVSTRNMQPSTPNSPSAWVLTTTSRPTLPVASPMTPQVNSRLAPNRPTRRPLTWLAAMSPAPLAPNARLNISGLKPKTFSSAKGAPAT